MSRQASRGLQRLAGVRVSLFRRGFWKKNPVRTVQVAIMCHARKKAPLHTVHRRHRGGTSPAAATAWALGTDAFGQSALAVVARPTLKASWGSWDLSATQQE